MSREESDTALTEQRGRLAALLRRLREATGLRQGDFGARIGMNQSKVSRIELGKQIPSRDETDAWADAADAADAAREQIADRLAAALTEASSHADDLAGGFTAKQARLALSEQSVSVVRSYALNVPGLLQTAEYARRLIAMQAPLHGGMFGDLAAAVAAWMDRQQALYTGKGRYDFLIPEAALRWRPGADAAVMLAAQLHHIATLSTLPRVHVAVLPWDADASVCVPHDFTILGDPGVDDDVEVAIYTTTRALRVRDPDEVATYLDVWNRLAADAIGDDQARAFLTTLASQFM
ncbi:MAG: helix-turn-helix domain-containing protein [Egibacteraceae bacterium]